MIATVIEARASAVRPSPCSRPGTALPLAGVLGQLADLLVRLEEEQYACKPVGLVASSIGGHVRHCLDHVEALLRGLENGLIEYDRRERGTQVECCRRAALETIQGLQDRLARLQGVSGALAVRLSVLVSPELPALEVGSTLDRELAYVLGHTIHHQALLAVMARTLGVTLPEHFGYAPATIAFRTQGGR